ncbi:uncharacterized protein LOC127854454 isoform X2 [Dreissena polymorpha]|uniref:uncharacterized protein LOC127854454 isoform X2 n=1 Tax=Dreissena polymorpha TaxID=45954 RepID=UPI002264BA50|nr:uncharacterized protein LOC127854454 isoform X2 [Dreissena polymorpha]
MTRIVFPCDHPYWWIIKDKLISLRNDCLQHHLDMQSLAVRHQSMVDFSKDCSDRPPKPWYKTLFAGLCKYFDQAAHVAELPTFLVETFPAIIDLALEIEILLPTEGISISSQQTAGRREISRPLCWSIVACAFLCLFPNEERGFQAKLGTINFNKFFHFLPMPSQCAKLQCILTFFERIKAERDRLPGCVVFARQVIKPEELPTLDTWLNCSSPLCPVVVHEEGLIEDAGCHTIEVDFANRHVGGGVLNKGRVQEEIRFTVCPELLVSILFMEEMAENEAIIISGFGQFSVTCGYAAGLVFVSMYKDDAKTDEHGNLLRTLCAIDAVSYRADDRWGSGEGVVGRQYMDRWVLRDLNKAFVGFCTPFTIPEETSPLPEEHYFTPDGSVHEPHLDVYEQFAENLLASVFPQSLARASRHVHDRDSSTATGHDSVSLNSMESLSHDCAHSQRHSSMDHLDVGFREWYNQYRRRSSNLSDLSSRRSSYDLASRRSSGCSQRGYSSELSCSDFEEYNENSLQNQDQRFKYHTIKEEGGSSTVLEFAASLAACLVRAGTMEAVVRSPSPHGYPVDFLQDGKGYKRPAAFRLSSVSAPDTLVNPSEEEPDFQMNEGCVRNYVHNLFSEVWPFPSEEDFEYSTSLCNEVRKEIQKGCAMSSSLIGVSRAEPLVTSDDVDSSNPVECQYDALNDSFSVVCEYNGAKNSEVDEQILLAVADRIVSIAFQEALIDYRCTLSVQNSHMFQCVSESSQSDHSMDVRDQSESSCSDTSSQSELRLQNNIYADPAEIVAEKMVSGLFGKNQPVTAKADSKSDDMHMSNRDSCIKYSDLKIDQSESGCHIEVGLDSQSVSVLQTSDCDIIEKADIDSTIPFKHSSQVSDNLTENQREIYNKIADRILMGGLCFTSAKNLPKCNLGRSGSTPSSNALNSQPSYPVDHPRFDKKSASHDESKFGLSVDIDDSYVQNSSSSSCHSFSHEYLTGSDGTRSKIVTQRLEDSSQGLRPPDISQPPTNTYVNSNLLTVKRGKNIENKNTSKSSQRKSASSETSRSKQSSSSLETSSSASDSSSKLGAVGGVPKSQLPANTCKTSQHICAKVKIQKSQSKVKSKPSYPFLTGNKKNYDQFANSLSRDLLTNAFLQVQEHQELVSYPRRSSEPMQISNDAALRRLEHSINHRNGPQGQKSKTDEDISQMDWDVSQQFNNRPSCGFRDPVLSRFAEELMKVDVSVPPLKLLGADAVSVSSSSQSVCSTFSSFRDPLLASFEEELLGSSGKSSCGAKTKTSWSNMKNIPVVSSRHVGINWNHQESNQKGQGSARSNQGGNLKSLNSNIGGKSNNNEMSASKMHKVANNVSRNGKTIVTSSCSMHNDISSSIFHSVSDLAGSLAMTILCEAVSLAANGNSSDSQCWLIKVNVYGEILAKNVLDAAMEALRSVKFVGDVDQGNKIVSWCEETDGKDRTKKENGQRQMDREGSCSESTPSSGDYEDAYDLPYRQLEEFADVLASKVLINSVAITRREHMSNLRRKHGRPITTGNWGCGAFGGDPHLKSLIQWMAASYAGCPCMLYYTFQNQKMDRFQEVADIIIQRGWDVSKLMQVVRRYCMTTNDEIDTFGQPTRELFDVILQGEIFPNV